MEKEKTGDSSAIENKKLESPTNGTKRKAASDDSDTPAKKSKISSESAEDEEDDGEGEED